MREVLSGHTLARELGFGAMCSVFWINALRTTDPAVGAQNRLGFFQNAIVVFGMPLMTAATSIPKEQDMFLRTFGSPISRIRSTAAD